VRTGEFPSAIPGDCSGSFEDVAFVDKFGKQGENSVSTSSGITVRQNKDYHSNEWGESNGSFVRTKFEIPPTSFAWNMRSLKKRHSQAKAAELVVHEIEIDALIQKAKDRCYKRLFDEGLPDGECYAGEFKTDAVLKFRPRRGIIVTQRRGWYDIRYRAEVTITPDHY
jgi:hypothetical protein